MTPPGSQILIVEDDAHIRRFVRLTLVAEGHTVHEAESYQRGLIEAATRTPDLVILDLGLPDGDGVDLIRELRQWSSMPVIVLSARSAEESKIAALDAGADDYLVKPFGSGELSARGRGAAPHPHRIQAADAPGLTARPRDHPCPAAQGRVGSRAPGRHALRARPHGQPAQEGRGPAVDAQAPDHRNRGRLPLQMLNGVQFDVLMPHVFDVGSTTETGRGPAKTDAF